MCIRPVLPINLISNKIDIVPGYIYTDLPELLTDDEMPELIYSDEDEMPELITDDEMPELEYIQGDAMPELLDDFLSSVYYDNSRMHILIDQETILSMYNNFDNYMQMLHQNDN
jgi:hypothetical protein